MAQTRKTDDDPLYMNWHPNRPADTTRQLTIGIKTHRSILIRPATCKDTRAHKISKHVKIDTTTSSG